MDALKVLFLIFLSVVVGVMVEVIFQTSENLEKIFYGVLVVFTVGMSYLLFRDDFKKSVVGMLFGSFLWAGLMWFLFFELPTH